MDEAEYRAIIAGLIAMLDAIGEHEQSWPGVEDAMLNVYDRALAAIGRPVEPHYEMNCATGAWSRWNGQRWVACLDPRTAERQV